MMRKRTRRPLAVLVVSALLVALTAGVALAATVSCNWWGGYCYGTAYADYIYGSSFVDYIKAYAGNDYVDAWHGNDQVNPGDGNDTVLGYYGNDYISGSALGGYWPTDELGNDYLYGEAGNDYIIDWRGYDRVYGGADNDTINVKDGSCYDYVDAGPGYDTVYVDSYWYCKDTVVNAENVIKSATGAKASDKTERPTPPDLSKGDSKSTAEAKSQADKDGSTPPKERTPAK